MLVNVTTKSIEDILYAAMFSNPEEITYVGPSLCITQTTVKKINARKSLCFITNIFDVNKKNAICCVEYENRNAD